MPKSTKINSTIHAKNIDISVVTSSNNEDYISLTDIAKYKDDENPRYIIQNWMRTRSSVEFLGLWEELNNPNFNRVEFDAFKNEAGSNSFVLTHQKRITSTNAIGIVSKSGRYGSTYAHTDIAFEFASWVSPEFKLYVTQLSHTKKANIA
ncbi:MAG: KilA-N domain-containing protein [Acutalibacteraceae bacterium]